MTSTDEIFGLIETSEAPDGAECLGYVPKRLARGPSRLKERDLTKAFKAAKKAGINVRIDVAVDGKLSIVPVETEDAMKPNPWDEVLDQDPAKVCPRLS
jgi:hypothetical protein